MYSCEISVQVIKGFIFFDTLKQDMNRLSMCGRVTYITKVHA